MTHQVVLNWSPPSDVQPSSTYNVYRATGTCPSSGIGGLTFSQVGTGVTALTFTDTNVSASTTYCYYGTQVNNGVESGPSNTAGGTVPSGGTAMIAIVKAIGPASTTTSPTTATFTGGNTNGNTNVISIIENGTTSLHITSVTDSEGNTYANVASLSSHNFTNNEWHSWWVAPVTNGSGTNNIVTVAWSAGPARVTVQGAEASGVLTPSPFDNASSAGTSSTTLNTSLTTAAANEGIFTLVSRSAGGVNWSGLSGTDLTGVTSRQTELNWFLSASGSNAITATASMASFGSSSIALKPASGGGGGGGTPTTIFSGSVTLNTSPIAAGSCSGVNTAATGVLTTDVVQVTFNSDPSLIAGYGPSSTGSLFLFAYPTAGNVVVKVCNSTASSITPGAATVNIDVVR